MNLNLRYFGIKSLRNIKKLYKSINNYSNFVVKEVPVDKVRNIGILAHIDAGKTTTTERMLFLSGLIDHMGEVHRGNTVTDYMHQERERGITITSAAVTFYWRNNQFNLIDTPGHIDFTMEVEQTLNVLDGAVVVLDGSAGVEAQTITVWRQADRNKIPRIVFVNKMDRNDADVKSSCLMIEKRLDMPYLLLQLPVKKNNKFIGLIDLLSMELVTFGLQDNKSVNKIRLVDGDEFYNDALNARSSLVDKLTNYDDDLANKVITTGSLNNISTDDLVKSIKYVTTNLRAVPVLLGSSYKNFGVQNLMDAVILYLPSPNDIKNIYKSFESNLCARAFKVIHHKQKGPLVFIRIYNGELNKNQKIYIINKKFTEQINRLYVAYADDFNEVDSIKCGKIAVVSGLKKVTSGDLITTSNSALIRAKNLLKNQHDDEYINKLFGINVFVPEPVFFRSIEPPNASSQNILDSALIELQREDPSLRVIQNGETGQTVLAGMGELHLEIIKDRILREYKLEVDLGPLQIAYREKPAKKITDTLIVNTKIGSSNQSVTVKLTLEPLDNKLIKDVLKLDKSPEYASNISNIFPKHLVAVKQGIDVGLAHGPKISCLVVDTQITLHLLQVGKGTSETLISATVTQLIQKMLRESSTFILEPIMNLEILAPNDYLSIALADLSKRRATIENVGIRGNSKLIICKAPLSELRGYSTILRTLSSGTATFTMELCQYDKLSPDLESLAIKEVRGF